MHIHTRAHTHATLALATRPRARICVVLEGMGWPRRARREVSLYFPLTLVTSRRLSRSAARSGSSAVTATWRAADFPVPSSRLCSVTPRPASLYLAGVPGVPSRTMLPCSTRTDVVRCILQVPACAASPGTNDDRPEEWQLHAPSQLASSFVMRDCRSLTESSL